MTTTIVPASEACSVAQTTHSNTQPHTCACVRTHLALQMDAQHFPSIANVTRQHATETWYTPARIRTSSAQWRQHNEIQPMGISADCRGCDSRRRTSTSYIAGMHTHTPGRATSQINVKGRSILHTRDGSNRRIRRIRAHVFTFSCHPRIMHTVHLARPPTMWCFGQRAEGRPVSGARGRGVKNTRRWWWARAQMQV